MCFGATLEVEYPRDTWRVRNLGMTGALAHPRFDPIPQPWLKYLAKRWARWRLVSGNTVGTVGAWVKAVTRSAKFLVRPELGIQGLDQVDRPVLELYRAELRVLGDGSHHQRTIGQLGIFLTDAARSATSTAARRT